MTAKYIRLALQLRVKMFTRQFRVEHLFYIREKSVEFERLGIPLPEWNFASRNLESSYTQKKCHFATKKSDYPIYFPSFK